MKQNLVFYLCITALLFSIVPIWAQSSDQIALSLRQRTEKGEVVLDIFVSNVSTNSVEIVSEGIVPPWSVWAWFKWEVDGKEAEYPENVALISNVKASWRIPKGGVVLWATIPIRALKYATKTELHSAIKDNNRHLITILPGKQWNERKLTILEAITNSPREQRKELKITPGKMEIGQEDTEQTNAAGSKR